MGRSVDKLKAKKEEPDNLREGGGHTFKVDVMGEEVLLILKDELKSKFNTIDGLINLAGGNIPGTTLKPDQTIQDNVIAPGFFITNQNRPLLTKEDTSNMALEEDFNKNTPVNRLGDKIHLRNVQRNEDDSFYEADHLEGSVAKVKVMQALKEEKKKRQGSVDEVSFSLHPDHGHVLLDDQNRQSEFYSGYSLMDKAMGSSQFTVLEKGIRANSI
jgi:NAD(P)-dependent dehydrogenase (short-subunit alcohol dehydrogenase family)